MRFWRRVAVLWAPLSAEHFTWAKGFGIFRSVRGSLCDLISSLPLDYDKAGGSCCGPSWRHVERSK